MTARTAALAARLALLAGALLAGCSPSGLDPEVGALGGEAREQELAALGRLLFFDTELSEPRGQSCASCHDPRWAFATPPEHMQAGISRGAHAERYGKRSAPSLLYAAFSPPPRFDEHLQTWVGGQLHDQRAASLEEQARAPFLNPLEMGNPSLAAVVEKVRGAPYAGRFERLYGRHALRDPVIGFERIALALAAFLRSEELRPFSSKFDAWLAGRATLTDAERRGFELFRDPLRANCAACHDAQSRDARPPLFTDFSSRNIGVPANPLNPFYRMPASLNPHGAAFVDRGVGADPRRPGMDGRFKTPTLRNVALTAPYMRNGVFRSLGEVVHFYSTACRAGNPEGWPPPEIAAGRDCRNLGNLGLSARDIGDLVAFLYALTDGWPHDTDTPASAAH
jgi:cytochrome c peroxidase